ncbi:MAG: YdcH family protein [Pseudomonadota bacterium]
MSPTEIPSRRVSNPNSLKSRLRALVETHQVLEQRIAAEGSRPMPDTLTVQFMKRRRLKAKDEIAFLGRILSNLEGPKGSRPSTDAIA